jgi:hypothetical protein
VQVVFEEKVQLQVHQKYKDHFIKDALEIMKKTILNVIVHAMIFISMNL